MTRRRRLPAFDLSRLFRRVVDHPWWTLGCVALITAVLAGFIADISVDVDFGNYLDRNDPAVVAADRARDRYGSQLMIMVIAEAEPDLFRSDALLALERLGDVFEEAPVIAEVSGPLDSQVIRGTESEIRIGPVAPRGRAPETPEAIAAYREAVLTDRTTKDFVVSSDGRAAAFYLRAKTGVEIITFAEEIEQLLSAQSWDPLTVTMSGIPYMNLTLGESMRRDLGIFLPVVFAVIVAVLAVAFRWTWGVVLPLAVVGASVLWTVGLMAVFDAPFTVVSFILPVVVMAIGIADGIHVLSRYREELSLQPDKNAAILATMSAMQRPVVMTSLTTAAGFLALVNSVMIPQRTFGVFTAVGILAAMLLSLLLLPAVLRLIPAPCRSRRIRRASMSLILERSVARIVRVRWVVLAGAVAVGVGLAGGFSQIEIETSQRAFLGENHPAVRALDLMDEHFSGGEQILIEIGTGRRDGLKQPELLTKIVKLQEFMEGLGVRRTSSLADIVRELNQRFHADDPAYYAIPDDPKLVAQLLLLFTFQGGDLGALALGDFSAGQVIGFHAARTGEARAAIVRDIEAYLEDHFSGRAAAEMVGSTRIQASMFASIARSQITSLATSIVAAGLIVVFLMGSVAFGVLSLIPLLFTVAINFGIMGYAGVTLDVATLMVSSITVGIGIDYGIHYIARYREARRSGAAADESAILAGWSAGRGIVYNALSLALGFSVLLLSAFRGMRSFGALVSMTMVISAISALLVIPAILSAGAWAKGRRMRRVSRSPKR